jgi:hypothetical protein
MWHFCWIIFWLSSRRLSICAPLPDTVTIRWIDMDVFGDEKEWVSIRLSFSISASLPNARIGWVNMDVLLD